MVNASSKLTAGSPTQKSAQNSDKTEIARSRDVEVTVTSYTQTCATTHSKIKLAPTQSAGSSTSREPN